MDGVRNVTPDRWLAEGDTVTVAGHTFSVLHCPGHSRGSVVFVNAAQRFILMGDVLFKGSIGRTDFAYGDHEALINAIKTKLLPLGDDYSFICGHGPMSTIGDERQSNPFLDLKRQLRRRSDVDAAQGRAVGAHRDRLRAAGRRHHHETRQAAAVDAEAQAVAGADARHAAGNVVAALLPRAGDAIAPRRRGWRAVRSGWTRWRSAAPGPMPRAWANSWHCTGATSDRPFSSRNCPDPDQLPFR